MEPITLRELFDFGVEVRELGKKIDVIFPLCLTTFSMLNFSDVNNNG